MPGFVSQADLLGAGGMASPKDAVGNGIVNDATALLAASTVLGYVLLLPGKNYRVSTNVTLGKVLSFGGAITIDAGVTLTISSARGSPVTGIIFKGAGRVIIKDRYASLGWYDGASADECHEFWRRGQAAVAANDVSYEWTLPGLSVDDPRATTQFGNTPCWKLNAPLKFDDPENQGLINVCSFLKAMVVMDCMIEYSPIKKTEQIEVPLGWKLYGDNKAKVGILIHGGARIIHGGRTLAFQCTDAAVRQSNDRWPTDEIQFGFLDVTGFGVYGYDANNVSVAGNGGSGTTNTSVTTLIGEFFSNGGVAATAQNYIRVRGDHRGFIVRSFLENQSTSNGLGDIAEASIVVENAANGAPRGVRIGPMQFFGSTKPAIIARDTTSGTGGKIFLSYDYIVRQTQPAGGAYNIDLSWIGRADLGPINEGNDANSILVNSTAGNCANVSIRGVRRQRVTGNCDYMTFNGQTRILIPTLLGTTNGGADNTNRFVARFDNFGRGSFLTVHTGNAAFAASGSLLNGVFQGFKGGSTDVTTADASTANFLTVVVAGDQLTVINRGGGDLTNVDIRPVA